MSFGKNKKDKKKSSPIKRRATPLRPRAEKELARSKKKPLPLKDGSQKLIHELQAHQIELEMQNEELKRAHEELQVSHRNYAELYDFAPAGHFICNAKGMMVEANSTAAGMLGVERAELLRSSFTKFISPEYWDVFRVHSQKVLQNGIEQECELKLIRKDDSFFYVWTKMGSVLDKPGLIRSAFLDITDRKAAEKIIRGEAERKYLGAIREQASQLNASLNRINELIHATLDTESVLENLAHEGRLGLGCDSTVVSLRDGNGWKICHISGLPSSLIGARMKDEEERHAVLAQRSGEVVTVEDAFSDPRFNQEHLRRHKIGAVMVAPLVLGKQGNGVIFFNYHKDPHKFTEAEVNFARHLASTAIIAFSNASLLKELKQAQEEVEKVRQDLERAQRVGQIGSWRLDVRRDVLTWSGENYSIFGVSSGIPMTYETFLEIVHPDDRQYVDTKWKAGLRGEPYDIEHRILLGQQVKWVREKAYLEFDDAGTLLGGFGITQDITERKWAEHEIQKLNEDLAKRANALELANKELEAFASMLSHDFKNQLIILGSFTKRLIGGQTDSRDAKGQEYLRIMNESVEKMFTLADDVLKLSRVVSSQTKMEKVNLSKLAMSIIRKFREKDSDRRVQVAIEKGIEVEGDQRLLEVMLENLLGNGWKFTKKSKLPRIEFGIRQENRGNVLYIRDNGCGFEVPDSPDTVFLPFQRFHSGDEYPGSGVGLATVKRILDRHGGKIWVESQVGEGTTFYFYIRDYPQQKEQVLPEEH